MLLWRCVTAAARRAANCTPIGARHPTDARSPGVEETLLPLLPRPLLLRLLSCLRTVPPIGLRPAAGPGWAPSICQGLQGHQAAAGRCSQRAADALAHLHGPCCSCVLRLLA